MNSKIEHSNITTNTSGIPYYIASILSIVVGLFFWYWLDDAAHAQVLGVGATAAVLLRVFSVLIGIALAFVLFLRTPKGRLFRAFLGESRFELRKVAWPTRQESIRTTWVVILVVSILSLLLGGFDAIIQKLTQWFLSR